MLNALCRIGQHDWLPMLVTGWFRCTRSDCRAVAVCPGCLGDVPAGASEVQFCSAHHHLAASLSLPERRKR